MKSLLKPDEFNLEYLPLPQVENGSIIIKDPEEEQRTEFVQRFPMYVCIVTIILALIPYTKRILTSENSLLKETFVDSMASAGTATYVMILLSAGANLAVTYQQTSLDNPRIKTQRLTVSQIPLYFYNILTKEKIAFDSGNNI